MARRKIHVVPYGDAWAVKREGADRASAICDTKSEAIAEAQRIAYRGDDEVIVHNKKGHITKGKKYGKKDDDGCFLTTACVEHFNLPDNCYQLETLRKFRDQYLAKSTSGKTLIKQYYFTAPLIVKRINQCEDKNSIYKKLFSQINEACELVEKRENKKAKELYSEVVKKLANQFQLV